MADYEYLHSLVGPPPPFQGQRPFGFRRKAVHDFLRVTVPIAGSRGMWGAFLVITSICCALAYYIQTAVEEAVFPPILIALWVGAVIAIFRGNWIVVTPTGISTKEKRTANVLYKTMARDRSPARHVLWPEVVSISVVADAWGFARLIIKTEYEGEISIPCASRTVGECVLATIQHWAYENKNAILDSTESKSA